MTTIHERLRAFAVEDMTRPDADNSANERGLALQGLVLPLIRLVDEKVVISDEHWASIELGLSTALKGSAEYGVERHYMTTQFAMAAYINSVAQ